MVVDRTNIPEEELWPIAKQRLPMVLMLGLFAITFIAYLPAIGAGYIWDDDDYVTENETLRSMEGLYQIWFDPSATPQYYPLVHTSYWIEYRFWQLHPLGYHVVNILLHALNAFLLYWILRYLRMPGAIFAAALYAVHPVNVESVAWITERKNVLAVLMFSLTTLAWFRFLPIQSSEQENQEPPNYAYYGLAILAFIGALFSKTVTCMWPVAIVLVYWGAHHRWRIKQLLHLIPFFIIGAGLGLFTAYLERKQVGAEGIEWDFSFLEKLMISGRVFWFYIGKSLLPYPLVFFYPRWEIDGQYLIDLTWGITILVLIAMLFVFRKRLSRWPVTAMLAYGATLFPAMGFFAVYPMRYSFVADHFAYIPFMTVMATIAGCVWQIPNLQARRAIAVVSIIVLSATTFTRCFAYQDAEILWNDTLAKNPSSCAAHNNLGMIYFERAQFDKAAQHFEIVSECRIEQHKGFYHLGLIEAVHGRTDSAIEYFQKTLEVNPRFEPARFNMAINYSKAGKTDLAIEQFHQIEMPELVYESRFNSGLLLSLQNNYEHAAKDFELALLQQPNSMDALINLAICWKELGKTDKASKVLKRAEQIDPYDASIGQIRRDLN